MVYPIFKCTMIYNDIHNPLGSLKMRDAPIYRLSWMIIGYTMVVSTFREKHATCAVSRCPKKMEKRNPEIS